MCGRLRHHAAARGGAAVFRLCSNSRIFRRATISRRPSPSRSCAATSARTARIERHFDLVRWGYLPPFVKDPRKFPLIFNARCETLLSKASFKNAFRRRRCLFIADAFYEWRRDPAGGRARPYLFRRRDGAPLGLGGIYESWAGPNGEEVDTACIITTAANGPTAAIHDRLPGDHRAARPSTSGLIPTKRAPTPPSPCCARPATTRWAFSRSARR